MYTARIELTDQELPPLPEPAAIIYFAQGGQPFYAESYELDDIGIVATGKYDAAWRNVGHDPGTYVFPWHRVSSVELRAVPEPAIEPEPEDRPRWEGSE